MDAAGKIEHTAENRRSGAAMQLLIHDRFQQRLKRRVCGLQSQGERPGAADEFCQLWVCGSQVRDGNSGIVAWGAATVGHEGSSIATGSFRFCGSGSEMEFFRCRMARLVEEIRDFFSKATGRDFCWLGT